MDAVILDGRGQVDALRSALAERYQLYEPRTDDEEVDWHRTSGHQPFDWRTALPLSSAKRFFFPARDVLLRLTGERIEETRPHPPRFVLFGLRACDLTAIAYQDRFFERDPWYRRRRARALLVGVNCLAACPGGFCKNVDAGPFARSGFDLNLTELPHGRILLELGTPRGHAVFEVIGPARAPVDAQAETEYRAVLRRAGDSFPARPFIARAVARISAKALDKRPTDAEWQALGPSCLACTGCTSLCPTCSCFTVVDETTRGKAERVRYWDSCLLEGFQREASGYHPAPRPGDRVRRFWTHKLADEFAPHAEGPGCVGCGRCDVACLGSIGALGVLERLGSR